MRKKLKNLIKKIFAYGFYLFVFLLPWQTKIVVRPEATSFNEISIYLSQIVLLALLVAFFVWQLLRHQDEEPASPLWLALVGLEIGVLVSFFFAPDQILAFYHYAVILVGIGLFYILRSTTVSHNYEDCRLDANKILASFLLSMFLQAVLAVYQFLNQYTPVSKYLGLAAHHAELAGTAVVETASGRWLRAYGGLDHPNILGGVLAICLIIAAYWLVKRQMIRSAREMALSAALFVFYFVALAALFFSFSRSGWLAFLFGLVVLAITFWRLHDKWLVGRFLALVFFSALMLFIIAFPYRDLALARTAGVHDAGARLEQLSLSEREQGWQEALTVISQHGLVGVGVGNYSRFLAISDSYARSPFFYQPVHNAFALLLAQSGIIALLSFLAFLIFLIKKDRRAVFGGAVLAALVIIMLFDHWLISLPFGVLFLFLVLGLL